MDNLRFVSFFGINESTNFQDVLKLSRQFPFIEWAIPFNPDKAGLQEEFAPLLWIEDFIKKANNHNIFACLHIQKPALKCLLNSIKNTDTFKSIYFKRLLSLITSFKRIQLNCEIEASDVFLLIEFVSQLKQSSSSTQVVFEHTSIDPILAKALQTYAQNGFEIIAPLNASFDFSGDTFPCVGVIEKLEPKTVSQTFSIFNGIFKSKPYWIQANLITDTFNFKEGYHLLLAIESFINANLIEKGQLFGKGSMPVQSLNGFWLDWWVGQALRAPLAFPDASSSVLALSRLEGVFKPYEPSSNPQLAREILTNEKIALVPLDSQNTWAAKAQNSIQKASSDVDMFIAGLKAVVVKHFGSFVPKNPYFS